jgi:hypothetical protein
MTKEADVLIDKSHNLKKLQSKVARIGLNRNQRAEIFEDLINGDYSDITKVLREACFGDPQDVYSREQGYFVLKVLDCLLPKTNTAKALEIKNSKINSGNMIRITPNDAYERDLMEKL